MGGAGQKAKARTDVRAFFPARAGRLSVTDPTVPASPRRRRSGIGIRVPANRMRRSRGDQAAFASFSTATVTRAVSGASACSVSLNEASVSLPDSASVFSSVERA